VTPTYFRSFSKVLAYSWLLVLASSYTTNVFSQNPFQGKYAGRVLNSYENVSWNKQSKQISFDQRLFRNPMRAIEDIRMAARDTVFDQFELLFQGFPVGVVGLQEDHTTYHASQRTKLSVNPKIIGSHLAKYKFDFWLQPVFAARFGYREKPVESNTSLILNTQLVLWPGMSLTGGVLFPLTNDMDNRPKIVRPAPIFVNQFWGNGSDWLSFTAGTFHNDRYGANLQYRKMNLTKPWSFGLEAGLTGVYYYPVGGIYYERPSEVLLLADIAHRFQRTDVTLKLTAGQFLHKDKGVRFDFIRQFTNVEVGLYAMKTTNGSTAGFNFAIPIPPGKIAQSKSFRVRTTDEFRWEYSYSRGYKIGERYRMGYQLDQKLRQFHLHYFSNQNKAQ
jgi:hypothetical protein